MLYDTGEEFAVVQKEVHKIIYGRLLVGHAIMNDLQVSDWTCGTMNILQVSGKVNAITNDVQLNDNAGPINE